MTKNESDSAGSHEDDLGEQPYAELMNVARSARENHGVDISTDAPEQSQLVERMREEKIHLDDGTWKVRDEKIERLESNPTPDGDGPSESQPEVILYYQTRTGANEERLDEIEDAIGEFSYELRENERGNALSVIIPHEEPGIDAEELTRDEVYEMAHVFDIDGRSDMSKAELVEAVEAARWSFPHFSSNPVRFGKPLSTDMSRGNPYPMFPRSAA